MRKRISRALARVLDRFPPIRRTRPGRHTAAHFATRPEPELVVICTAGTPLPAHVLARTAPSPWGHRVPPYLHNWIREQETQWEQQRGHGAGGRTAPGRHTHPAPGNRPRIAAALGVPA
jgi:hypothetical protein